MSVAATAQTYPVTATGPVAETLHGERIADPYRWLEDDVRTSPAVAEWVAAQNKVTGAYLATLPERDAIAARLKALWDYERFGVPRVRGGVQFYTRNSGLQNQAVLYAGDKVLIDPNPWAADGATALAEWEPSPDGKHLLYAVQDGGSDWRTVKVRDVATGADLADRIEWVKFSGLAWTKDGKGFFYSRFAAPAKGQEFQSENLNQQVYFHALGTPQSADRLVFATPENPKWNNSAEVSEDGRWLVITSSEGTDERFQVTVADLASGEAPRTLIKGLEHSWGLAGSEGDTLFLTTNKQAPRYRLVAMNARTGAMTELVAEGPDTIVGAAKLGNRFVIETLADARSKVRLHEATGALVGEVPLPGIGSVTGFEESADGVTHFSFSSFATPATIWRYDARSNAASVLRQPKVAFDAADYVVRQMFFTSKDGTRVPMFVSHRKDLDPAKTHPALLYGYGGFNISLPPGYSASRLAWMAMGGIFVQANLRGGGEYGAAWHDAGRLANKQNVFDDFIGAGEALVKAGLTSPAQLAIQGGSNGGLLVGAVVNQRPDLFAAALPAVGVMDMLRFDKFTAGRYWIDDYGDPAKAADFKVLRTYSPYHNIKAGTPYPAILVTTADTDDRVVPGHSFKYAAAIQAAKLGPKPQLIRIETRAGHGSGKPTDKIIAEAADLWAFAGYWTGLTRK
ncbi:prolyl oligopeptidase [Polymorphobacter multimanifer]|uniref:prolyl oligopeptidase n=1 Tax=Polymorphobacter multimanifer TaxID=1070431 RepID=A0A841L6Z8_9SPHN|nr:prolyl oligopeptidase family serine peptidase [Polymorphobacter multimanifer]MBB6228200.1 prolyl oligopeptidase [Polymorphobacter multimanifer]